MRTASFKAWPSPLNTDSDDVVGIFAIEIGDVQVHASVVGQGIEKFLEHFRFKGPDAFDSELHVIH